jgi:hypothetical protein
MTDLKKMLIKASIVLAILSMFNLNLGSRAKHNTSEIVFDSGPGLAGYLLKQLITGAAGHYLNSYSSYLTMLNRIELADEAGIDYNDLKVIIDISIDNMEKAKNDYTRLKETADQTPYRQEVVQKLLTFDYEGFQNSKALNKSIFKEVESFLKRGDIRGIYSRVISNTGSILTKLCEIKKDVDEEKFPQMEYLWRLNQEYSEVLLFGQYVAEIFAKIKSEMAY